MHTVVTGKVACSDEIIQIMEKIWYLVGSVQDPFHHAPSHVKDKQSRSKSKGEKHVHMELRVVPLHLQQVVMIQMDRHIAICCLHTIVGQKGPSTKLRY